MSSATSSFRKNEKDQCWGHGILDALVSMLDVANKQCSKKIGSVWFSKFLLPKLQSHSFRREVLTVFNGGRFSLPWPCSSCFTSHFLVLERWLGRKNKTSTNNFFELASSLPAILRVQPNPNVDFTFFGSPLSSPAMQMATHAAQWHMRQVLTG